ncbi:MAG TPA: hypothetical protein VK537_05795, partial [Galbitalea sp.]|nr:hypothetical protein [Galbitalea sp.]
MLSISRLLSTRSRRARSIAVLATLAGAAIVLSGCSASGAKSPTTIVLYNAQHEQTTTALVKAFTKQ